jgi:tubulin alpha
VNVGDKIWELYCLEHGICPDGVIYEGLGDDSFVIVPEDTAAMSSFFSDCDGKYSPRSLMVDLENDACDNVRCGAYRHIYDSDQIISCGGGGGSNYARGHFGVGKDMLDRTLESIRKLTDDCENLEGFMIHHSTGGGTGSGFTALLMERLASIYDGKERVTVTVQPSASFDSCIVEPYNHICSLHSLLEYANSTVFMANTALFDICKRSLDIGEFLSMPFTPHISSCVLCYYRAFFICQPESYGGQHYECHHRIDAHQRRSNEFSV